MAADRKEIAARRMRREAMVRTTGFVELDPQLIGFLAGYSPFVEIGAGTGAMSEAIRDAGGASHATDNFSWPLFDDAWRSRDVVELDACKAVEQAMDTDMNVLCSWPAYDDDWAYRAIRLMNPDTVLAYIGERAGGSTGCDQFHDMLAKGFEEIDDHPTNPSQDSADHCWVFRRLG